ncbi:hypothetical protein [Aureimonas sp. Leaf324]|uniref:hypothetical protein n=1 Tax=Aureimonas sp. Leaf324 TaxID=1736336 RepID=UPI0006F82406|nr:hypothetical protein [Aureimonas sp. Leaf324]KQQ85670.1 hypothetical protein ASF65_03720 [Aureimonas sp. Leaf324]
MTKTRIIASALLAAASFGTMSAAQAVVPGSDTYERARDGAAVMSVIEGTASRVDVGTVTDRAIYGFPNATSSNGALVPGSRSVDDAAERDAVMSVITGTPGASYTAGPAGVGTIVPGSDSF